MKYLGGKKRIAKDLSQIINKAGGGVHLYHFSAEVVQSRVWWTVKTRY